MLVQCMHSLEISYPLLYRSGMTKKLNQKYRNIGGMSAERHETDIAVAQRTGYIFHFAPLLRDVYCMSR